MAVSTHFVNLLSKSRLTAIDGFRKNPAAAQDKNLKKLIRHLSATRYGQETGVSADDRYERFADRVPIATYDTLKPYIDRMRQGEENVLWDSRVEWFAKSSGTTADVSKYIPVSKESLQECHYQGARDVLAVYLNNHPGSKLFTGKTLTLGGSYAIDADSGGKVRTGDLSAILIRNTPFYASTYRTPSPETALTADFEEKIRKICAETVPQNITSFAGVPSWNMVLLNAVLQ